MWSSALKKSVKLFCGDALPVVHRPSAPSNRVVLILGWGGAKQRNLRKLVQSYSDRGVTSITMVMPLLVPELVRRHITAEAASMLATELKLLTKEPIVEDQCADKADGKYFLHSYSNNGAWTYATLLKQRQLPSMPSAVIMDAAPFFMYEALPIIESAKVFSRVLTSTILKKDVYYQFPLSEVLITLNTVMFAAARLIIRVQGDTPIIPEMEKMCVYLRDSAPAVPTLFLYSTGDRLVPPEQVRDFMGKIKSRGVPVEDKVFGDEVGHTGSFFLHPKEYMDSVTSFLDRNNGAAPK